MDIIEALIIFNIEDINNLTEEIVKKQFRGLMLKNHPDIGGNEEKAKEINEAHSLISKFLKDIKAYQQIAKKSEFMCIIPLNKLSKIYMGEELDIRSKSENLKLHRRNLRSNKVILLILVNIMYKGCMSSFENLCVTNIKDEYYVECKLIDTDISNAEELTIRAYDKEVNTTIKGSRLNIVLSFDNLVKLTIHIERVEKHGQQDT